MFLIRKDALLITHTPQWFPVTTTCFPQAFVPFYDHWPFLAPAKLLCHSLLLPLCYNCLALTALSCVTGEQARIAFTTHAPSAVVSISSSPQTGFASCDIISVTIVSLLDYFGLIQHLDRTAHTVQHNQLGPQPPSSDSGSAAPAPANSDATHCQERGHTSHCRVSALVLQPHNSQSISDISQASSSSSYFHKNHYGTIIMFLYKQSWMEAQNWNLHNQCQTVSYKSHHSFHVILHLQLSDRTVSGQWKDLLHRHYKLKHRWVVRVSISRSNITSSLLRGTSSSLLFIYSFQFA